MVRKRIISAALLAAASLAAACTQEIVYPVTCNVTLDPANTYLAGDPVRFNISGDADNLLFYSGETNHQYKYKDRYSVSRDEINGVTLHIDYQARYGYADGLSVYVSNSFEGLSGDFEADKALMAGVVSKIEAGDPAWKELDYEEGPSTVWTAQDYDISDYASNFVLAFHWHPKLGSSAQRHYWLDGKIDIDIKGAPASTLRFTGLDWEAIMLNDEYTQGHYSLSANPGFNMTKPATAAIMVNGCNGAPSMGGGAGGVEYAHDGWIFTKAKPLTSVSHDTGEVIKNLQNYLHSYEYTFEKPGTYTVTFVGTNNNVDGASRKIKELEINIFPKL